MIALPVWAAEKNPARFYDTRLGEYVFRVFQDYLTDESAVPSLFDETVVILKNRKPLYVHSAYRLEIKPTKATWGDNLAAVLPFGKNLTGDGEPNVVIAGWSGGATCCYDYLILAVGKEFRVINYFETADVGLTFVDLDDEPGLEIKTGDTIFLNWKTDFAQSPVPTLIYKYRDGKYQLAPELMQIPPLAATEFDALARKVRSSRHWKSLDPEHPYFDFLKALTDLVYSGNAKQARQLLDKTWRASQPGKKEFWDAFFACQLRRSAHWPVIAEMNGLAAEPPHEDCVRVAEKEPETVATVQPTDQQPAATE